VRERVRVISLSGRGPRHAFLCLAAAAALGGCASLDRVGTVKAYDGPERPAEEGLLSTQLRDEVFQVAEGTIISVDGVPFAKPAHGARMLAGTHWVGVVSSVRQGSLRRDQFCAFEIPVDAGCTYLPVFPSYPGVGLEAGAKPWQVVTSLLMNIECPDTSYATRVTLECSSRALCRAGAGCPKPGMRCVEAPSFSFGACSAP
jgi:hypothetical protein